MESEQGLVLRGTRVVSGGGLFQTFATSKDKAGRARRRDRLLSRPIPAREGSAVDGGNKPVPSPSSGSVSATINNAGAHRQQLTMFALDIEFPPGTCQREELATVYSQWFQARGKAMEAAIDCTLLLYFGRAKQVKGLGLEVSRLHGTALARLRRELEAPGALYDDGVLGAVAAFAMTANFSELSLQDEYWTHHDAVEQIIRNRGPSSMSSTFARQIISNLTINSLIKSIHGKRSMLISQPEWIAALRPHCTTRSSRLGLVGLQCSGIIAAVDHLDDLGLDLQPYADGLIKRIKKVKTAVRRELPNLYELTVPEPYTKSNKLYNYRSTSMKDRAEEDAAAWPFGGAPLSFKDGLSAMSYTWYLCVLYFCDEALLDIRLKLMSEGVDVTADGHQLSVRATIARLDTITDVLCRATPYLHSGGNIGYADIFTCGSLTYALRWYERSEAAEKAEWCRGALGRLGTTELVPAMYDHVSYYRRVFCGWPMLV